ncbi:MAG: oxygenase MpaB family protein, partial [Actinomycetota bacterium]
MALRESDPGIYGPESMSWRVHKETTVLFGGARALLMQAAHPLVIAGARKTGFYQRNPWKRLERTLQLAYTITFGTRAEATAAADHINEVHRSVKGIDDVTGLPYDAFDPDLLLWVHACLVESAILFEELTVGKLTAGDKEVFHQEQMVSAEMLGLDRALIPPTVPALRAYIDMIVDSDELIVGESALQVADTIRHPPPEAEYRPVLAAVSFWAFG